MRRFIGISTAVLSSTVLLAFTGVAAADQGHNIVKSGSSTTLDACGYFVGAQNSKQGYTTTGSDGVTSHTESGTWTGVSNNYGFGPVLSLGAVQGAYSETTQTGGDPFGSSDPAAYFQGTEQFVSGAGKINQTFYFSPSNPGGWTVTVTATRDLSFLTSDTNGNCYPGPFPRS